MLDDKRGVIYHGSGENYSSSADGKSDAAFAADIKSGPGVIIFDGYVAVNSS